MMATKNILLWTACSRGRESPKQGRTRTHSANIARACYTKFVCTFCETKDTLWLHRNRRLFVITLILGLDLISCRNGSLPQHFILSSP